MTEAPRILIVDDDQDLRNHVAAYLQEHGFRTTLAADGRAMDQALNQGEFDLVILDVMLPGEDGLSICRRLSAKGSVPVIIVSAMGEEIDRVLGLELGADDYLPKPCSPRELLARVRAVLRRRSGEPEPADASAQKVTSEVTFDSFRLDLLRRQLYAPDGSVIVLTSGEFSLLAALIDHPLHVMRREVLAELSGIGDPADVDRAVDVQISRLRRKLQSKSNTELIVTVRGQGYKFCADVSPRPPGLSRMRA
jgi:two-component system OmpR family response regulator